MEKGSAHLRVGLKQTFPTVTTLGAGDVAQAVEGFPSMPEVVGSVFNTVPTRYGSIVLLISAVGRYSRKEDKKFR